MKLYGTLKTEVCVPVELVYEFDSESDEPATVLDINRTGDMPPDGPWNIPLEWLDPGEQKAIAKLAENDRRKQK